MRNAVASGSGYFCNPACTTRPIAAFTFGEHWYGFSFVLSLMNFSPLRLLAGHVAFHFGDVGANSRTCGEGVRSQESGVENRRVH